MPLPLNSIVGCILAGGRSLRMGGGDKALLDLEGKPLLAHVIARLSPQVSRVVINANGDPQRFSAFGLPVAADTLPGFAGPLAGLLSGLRWAQLNASECSHAVTVSGDAPFLPDDLVHRLSAACAGRRDTIVLAASGGQAQPLMGLWPVSLADDLEADLKAGARSVLAWALQRGAIQAGFPAAVLSGRSVDPFFNANSPLDLAEARLLLQRQTYPSPVIGIAGWKNSGKTTLVTRLVEILTQRGHRISTIKFSHHEGSADAASDRIRDTARHAAAGAVDVGFVSPSRWAIVHGARSAQPCPPEAWHETSNQARMDVLRAIMTAMASVDLVLVEGFKAAAIPKIEVRRAAEQREGGLAGTDQYIFAIASDHPVEDHGRWTVALDDPAAVASEIERIARLEPGQTP